MLHRWTSGPKWFSRANWLALLGASNRATSRPNASANRSAVAGDEVATLVEAADADRALPGLDDDLAGAGVEPLATLGDQPRHDVRAEGTVVLLPELELDLQAPVPRHAHDLGGRQRHVREPFAGLDPGEPDVRDEVEVERQLPCWTAISNGPPPVTVGTPKARTRRPSSE